MIAHLPNPLVPAEVDLRGLDYMPFWGHHLLGSEFHARCSDAEWRAGVTLWWAAWNQVPAASLPDDDIALARLADLGRDVKAWKRIRDNALHGFVLCSDGRLYHRFLAQQALIAWDKRVKERARKANWRAGQNRTGDGDRTRTETRTKTGQAPGQSGDSIRDGTADGTRRDETGRDVSPSLRSGGAPPVDNPATTTRCGQVCKAMREIGITSVNPSHPDLRTLVEAGTTDAEFEEGARKAKSLGKGFAYALAVIDGRRKDAANPRVDNSWRRSNQGIDAKGRELGMAPGTHESYEQFAARLEVEIERRAYAAA